MRFHIPGALATAALALLLLPTGLARPRVSRTVPSSDILASRQHAVTREYQDTCAYIDADVLNSGILPLSLDVDLCLCIGILPQLVTADVQLEALLDLLGLDELVAKLSVVIGDSPNGEHCTYPDHAYAVCSQSTPCGFECSPPYVAENGECVCAAPFTSCNGVCGLFPHGCGSAAPRSLNPRMNKRAIGSSRILTLAEAEATCAEDETVCGVYGGSSRGFECLNTDSELESCGGCVVPNPFLPAINATAPGRDCTGIEGVNGVSCIAGQCAVSSCIPGYIPSSMSDSCVETLGAEVPVAATLPAVVVLGVQQDDKVSSKPSVGLIRLFAETYDYALRRFLELSGLSA